MECFAYAKINLTLDVGALRDDGFHPITSVMQEVSLHDRLQLSFSGSGAPRLYCSDPSIPTDERNLCFKAARALQEASGLPLDGLEMHLEKRVPSMAGMGGGSADAAAVLRALNAQLAQPFSEEALREIGLRVGSDIPFCLFGGTALAQGRGEVLTALPSLPICPLVLIQPAFQVSTAALFSAIDHHEIAQRPDQAAMQAALQQGDVSAVAAQLCNVFEQALPSREQEIVQNIKAELLAAGALGAAMTGTGSVVYGLFPEEETAQRAANLLRPRYPFVTVCFTR